VLSVLVFAGTEMLPGDAATAILGRQATPESLQAIRDQLELDKPAAQRYLEWLGGFLRGDLGESLTGQRPVSEFLSAKITNTLILGLLTVAAMIPIAVGLGVWAGIRVDRPADHVISSVSLSFIALPEFVTGTLLTLIFGITLKLVPPVSLVAPGSSPFDQPSILVLPIVTLLLAALAYTIRMVRAGVVEVIAADYVHLARLSGIGERRVIVKHALRNALAPSVQVIALTIAWLVGGVFVVETVFQYPGIGQGLVQAVNARDIPLVQSVSMLIAALYVGINLVADLLVVFLIPKLRTAA
jgi:peptide/nickel transport system permease protein